ncbi:S41 family peptidase [Mucilaginibacter terrenus]|nr:S41 family peptidase [Mucilaginibacter terrenus]
MKMRTVTTIVLMSLIALNAVAQTREQTSRLATFARVWGFLKYYHPEAAKGHPDWDVELTKRYLTITKLKSDEEFNKLLISWYKGLPKAKVSTSETQPKGDSIIRVFSEHDINKLNIAKDLKRELLNLYRYHLPDSSKYINNKEGGYTYDHIFHNEDMMEKPDYPDEAHRFLALARFWNIVNYFYPHKAVNTPDWDKVLADFVPQFVNAADADQYREAFLKLTCRIRDSHSWFLNKEWNAKHGDFLNMPFDTYYAGGKYIIGYSRYDSLMKANNFKIGDEILAVNGTPVAERERQIKSYTTGTNNAVFHRDLGRNLFRFDSSRTVNVTLSRNGQVIESKAKMYSYGELYQYRLRHRAKLWEDMGNGIFYVRICEIADTKNLKNMYEAIKDARGVIWEMRDYPSFKIVQAMFPGIMANRGRAEIDYEGVLEYPGVFKANMQQLPAEPDTLNLPLYKGKLVVLVNEHTQSLAESVALELRMRPNTIIMGRQTAGTTGNMIRIDMPGGIQGSYTAVKVVGLNRSFEEGKGVKLDREVKLTPAKICSAEDYLLQQAYKEALKN